MTAAKKDPKQFPPEFVDALFQLPLPARRALARRFELPLTEEQLVLPTDLPDHTGLPNHTAPTPEEKPLSREETEAEALRALMGYGKFSRRREGSHDC